MHASHLVAPACISWQAESPLIPDDDVVSVRTWLAQQPYEAGGFLGWDQSWLYALGMIMFLVSETSRTVRSLIVASSSVSNTLI